MGISIFSELSLRHLRFCFCAAYPIDAPDIEVIRLDGLAQGPCAALVEEMACAAASLLSAVRTDLRDEDGASLCGPSAAARPPLDLLDSEFLSALSEAYERMLPKSDQVKVRCRC